jgi:hypothetical protein
MQCAVNLGISAAVGLHKHKCLPSSLRRLQSTAYFVYHGRHRRVQSSVVIFLWRSRSWPRPKQHQRGQKSEQELKPES